MKELSIKEKAKRYDEAIELAKDSYNYPSYPGFIRADIVFPELKESEDERIRKALISILKSDFEKDTTIYDISVGDIITWLEKQGSEPNWCHHKVDLSDCSEEYCKAYYDGWNNCNMQHSQCKLELDDVLKCLINGMKFYYEDNKDATWGTDKWSMPVKHIIEVLEKQGEQKPVEPNWIHHKVDLSDCSEEYRKAYYDGWNNCNQQHEQIKAEQKPAWNGEDEDAIAEAIIALEDMYDPDDPERCYAGYTLTFDKAAERLKSLRPQSMWKASEEMLEALYRLIPENVMEISEDEMLLDKLYQGLKYGSVLSKK